MAAWLPQPVAFDSAHSMSCDGFTPEQCAYYQEHWHNWYVADWAYALPTVAFFMSTIGIFVLGYVVTWILAWSGYKGRLSPIWHRGLAMTRYLSYRGWHVKSLRWNTASLGTLLLGFVGTVYFFCMDIIPSPYYWPGTDAIWGNSPPLGTRSGWLALACMPFLFATASKTNWITLVTGIPHEKLQVFHRWIAYAFFILALMHTFPFIVWHIHNGDMVEQFNVSNTFEYWTGVVALLFQAWLTGASWGPFRSLGYEFFKAMHFLAAVVFMVVFFWHCSGTLTSWHYFVATAAIYIPCWAYPWARTLFEYGIGQKAQLFVEDNGFIRISIPANFDWVPGQHCFLRFTSFGLSALSSHPFTICSLPSETSMESELVFYVRHRGGFTARLYEHAKKLPGVKVPVLVDGPYGGIDRRKIDSSDRLIVIAGGAGAGWLLPFVETWLRESRAPMEPYLDHPSVEKVQHDQHSLPDTSRPTESLRAWTRGPRSLRLILATRESTTRSWFLSTVYVLMSKYRAQEGKDSNIAIEIHLTGEAEQAIQSSPIKSPNMHTKPSGSSSSSDPDEAPAEIGLAQLSDLEGKEEISGRPDLLAIISDEATAGSGAGGRNVAVFACGPISMQDDIRNAVAKANLTRVKTPGLAEMYLHLEHFSWA